MIALAFRENRIKNRDLWDIGWLVQQGIELPVKLIPLKVADHQREGAEFFELLRSRVQGLKSQPEMRNDFAKEMRRLLPAATVRDTVEKETYWEYLIQVIDEQATRAIAAVR